MTRGGVVCSGMMCGEHDGVWYVVTRYSVLMYGVRGVAV